MQKRFGHGQKNIIEFASSPSPWSDKCLRNFPSFTNILSFIHHVVCLIFLLSLILTEVIGNLESTLIKRWSEVKHVKEDVKFCEKVTDEVYRKYYWSRISKMEQNDWTLLATDTKEPESYTCNELENVVREMMELRVGKY